MKLYQIQLDITNRCNMSCCHCRNGNLKESEISELTYDECIKVYEEARDLGCEWVNICGGEPLLHPSVFEIIKTISVDSTTILLTNGYLIDDEVADKLKDSNISMVQISLDSCVPEKHNRFRNCKNAYKHIERAIKALTKKGIEVCLMVTLSQVNKDEFARILELGKELGVSYVNFRRLIPQGNGKDNFQDLSLSKDEISEILDKAKKMEMYYTIGICLFPFYILKDDEEVKNVLENPPHEAIGGCSAGVAGLSVNSEGGIQLCPHIPIILGNIRKDNFSDIWLSNELVLKLRNRSNLKGQCGKCKFVNICGGCRAYPYQITGDIFEEDSLCTEYSKHELNDKKKVCIN